jgi:MYXO-CTERM domain-containing protein
VVEEPTGCSVGRSGSSGLAGTLLALGAVIRRRRRTAR